MKPFWMICHLLVGLSGLICRGSTIYFVDYQAGDDQADGRTRATAWKHCPGDASAQSKAQSISLEAGDLIKFKGGIRHEVSAEVRWSGKEGQPIVYDGNSLGNWGEGRAIINNQNGPKKRVFYSTNGCAWVHFRGFQIEDIGGYADDDPIFLPRPADAPPQTPITSPFGGTGMSFEDASSHLLIDSIFFRRIGQWRNIKPFSGVNSVTGTGIGLQNNEFVEIRNCEFTQMRVGISVKVRNRNSKVSDITIDSCDFHNYLVWLIDIAPRSSETSLENISILNSSLHDYHEFDSGNWMGFGEKPHTDGIFLRNSGATDVRWTNINIVGNEFYSDFSGASRGGTAAIYVSQGPSANIYNNTFRNVRHTRNIAIEATIPRGNYQTVRVFNNSFVGSSRAVSINGTDDPSRQKIYVLNNIFYKDTTSKNSAMISWDNVRPVDLNHNLYFSQQFGEADALVSVSGSYRTLGAMKAVGLEANGVYAAPGFMDLAPNIRFAASRLDLRLKESSSARKAGQNLSLLTSVDIQGIPRAATGAWDLGAWSSSEVP